MNLEISTCSKCIILREKKISKHCNKCRSVAKKEIYRKELRNYVERVRRDAQEILHRRDLWTEEAIMVAVEVRRDLIPNIIEFYANSRCPIVYSREKNSEIIEKLNTIYWYFKWCDGIFPPTKKASYLPTNDDVKEELRCTICYGDFVVSEPKVIKLICKHIYHENCINLWCERKNECPLCKAKIDF